MLVEREFKDQSNFDFFNSGPFNQAKYWAFLLVRLLFGNALPVLPLSVFLFYTFQMTALALARTPKRSADGIGVLDYSNFAWTKGRFHELRNLSCV